MQPTAAPPRTATGLWPWVLGVQCWLVWVLGPRTFRGQWELPGALATLGPPAVLLAAHLARRRGYPTAPWTLGAFPASLALGLWGFDAQQALSTFSPWVLAVGAVSAMAHAAVSARGSQQGESQRARHVHPLGESHLVATDPRRALAQRLLLGGTFLGLLALVVFSGHGAALRYHEGWGEGAAAGATLVATLAGLTGAVAMAGIVGPALRAERPRGSAESRDRRRMRRLAWLLAVAVSGALAYTVLQLGRG